MTGPVTVPAGQAVSERLRVRFGPWSVSTPVRNLAGAVVTGPFRAATTPPPS